MINMIIKDQKKKLVKKRKSVEALLWDTHTKTELNNGFDKFG